MLAGSMNEKAGSQGSYKTKDSQQIELCDKHQTDQEQKALRLTLNRYSKAESMPRWLPEVWLHCEQVCSFGDNSPDSGLTFSNCQRKFGPPPPICTTGDGGT